MRCLFRRHAAIAAPPLSSLCILHITASRPFSLTFSFSLPPFDADADDIIYYASPPPRRQYFHAAIAIDDASLLFTPAVFFDAYAFMLPPYFFDAISFSASLLFSLLLTLPPCHAMPAYAAADTPRHDATPISFHADAAIDAFAIFAATITFAGWRHYATFSRHDYCCCRHYFRFRFRCRWLHRPQHMARDAGGAYEQRDRPTDHVAATPSRHRPPPPRRSTPPRRR
jgi:hypothetical protein